MWPNGLLFKTCPCHNIFFKLSACLKMASKTYKNDLHNTSYITILDLYVNTCFEKNCTYSFQKSQLRSLNYFHTEPCVIFATISCSKRLGKTFITTIVWFRILWQTYRYTIYKHKFRKPIWIDKNVIIQEHFRQPMYMVHVLNIPPKLTSLYEYVFVTLKRPRANSY